MRQGKFPLWWPGRRGLSTQHDSDYTRLRDPTAIISLTSIKTKDSYTQVPIEEHGQRRDGVSPSGMVQPGVSRRSSFTGWRVGALAAAGLGFVSLFINIAATAWLNSHATFENGLAELYRDDCEEIRRVNTYVHLTINVISTLLLGGSNYCMQCLVAPNRKLVDEAHRRGRWLDIGIPSIRNLRSISPFQRALWLVLALSSLPLHLMYNSSIYASLSTHSYDVHVLSSDYVDYLHVENATIAQQWVANHTDWQLLPQFPGITEWRRLDNAECIRTYARDIVPDRGSVIVVSTGQSGSELEHYQYNASEHLNQGVWSYEPYPWICTDPQAATKYSLPQTVLNSDFAHASLCYNWVSLIEASPDTWAPYGYNASYCLSQPASESCGLNANLPILVTVIVCNIIKCLVMLYVAFLFRHHPLIVVGDAVESFLDERDVTTRDTGLVSLRDVVKMTRQEVSSFTKYQIKPSEQGSKPRHPRRYAAASRTRWIATISLFGISILVMLAMLLFSLLVQLGADKSIGFIWRLGFGAVNGLTLIAGARWAVGDLENYSARVLSSVLIANIPQLILSVLYFNLNGLVTSICLAIEWAKYSTQRAMMRVSNPRGNQRSSYFLTIPYRYAIPLLVTSALLHWVVSQSIFLVVVNDIARDGSSSKVAVVSCGYSPMAIIICLLLSTLILSSVVALGFPRMKCEIPLAGSCSVAISAACHPPEDESQISLKPVQWGVIPGSTDVDNNFRERCAFSSREVEHFVPGRQYW